MVLQRERKSVAQMEEHVSAPTSASTPHASTAPENIVCRAPGHHSAHSALPCAEITDEILTLVGSKGPQT